MIYIEYCRESDCDYYFGGLDDCMYGDNNIPNDYLKMCETARYQVYLISKENEGDKKDDY